jgi:signal transduction histidine kinase
MICGGIIGISQLRSLSKIVEYLGKNNLARQKAIFEMRTANAAYATGVRNHLFWRTFKYLGAVSGVSGLEQIQNAAKNFDQQLKAYSSLIESEEERVWISRLLLSVRELREIGARIVQLTESEEKLPSDELNRFLVTFENKVYRIDDFLSQTLDKGNLKDIETQLLKAEKAKMQAVWLLGWFIAAGVFLSVSIAIFVYHIIQREHAQRQRLVQRMINMEAREREDFSRQLHDQMGQDLSALKIYLGIIDQKIPQGLREVKEKIGEGKEIITRLIERMHKISELLRPSILDDIGLVESLEELILYYKHLSHSNFIYRKPQQEIKLPPEHSLTIYRIAQEGLNNVVKHSQAKNVEMELKAKDRVVEFSLKDDGVGFNYEQFLKERQSLARLGLRGLKERVELLGGQMEINTAPDKGTAIIVKLYS